jgi:radical SAM protein with 4Fe4S-binding SPASM domain
MPPGCPETIWLNNEEYLKRFNETVIDSRIPLSGSIDLTQRCNLRCIHCYHGEHQRREQKELTTKETCSLIDQITDAGCLYLLITGGEPTLRKDFPEIYSHARKKGLIITVFTNGTLISDEVIILFKEFPPYEVEISVYGATASTYEKISGVPGSYAQCITGVRKLLKGGIHLRLKTILMNVNSHEFFGMRKMAEEFGVKFRFDAALFPRFGGDKTPLSYRVSPEEAVEKEFSDEENITQWKKFYKKMQGSTLADSMYHCGAGRASFHIDPYGNLTPCLMTTNISYNMRDSGFLDGWNDSISAISHKKTRGDLNNCNQCEKIHLCGYCPAFFALENGEEHVRSEYICSLGSERFRRLQKHLQTGYENAT